jgi:hypothetical protein
MASRNPRSRQSSLLVVLRAEHARPVSDVISATVAASLYIGRGRPRSVGQTVHTVRGTSRQGEVTRNQKYSQSTVNLR